MVWQTRFSLWVVSDEEKFVEIYTIVIIMID